MYNASTMVEQTKPSKFYYEKCKRGMYGSPVYCTHDFDYKQLKKALTEYYKPQNPVEEVLVDRIAVLDWRLKRNVLAERKSMEIRPGHETYLPPPEAIDRILKYDRTADRELHRAITALEQLRDKKEKNEAPNAKKSAGSRSDGAEPTPGSAPEKGSCDPEKGPGVLKKGPYDPAIIPVSESTLEAVFSSSIRIKILRLFFGGEQDRFYLREISAKIGGWHGPVQREIAKLTDAGLLVRELSGRQTYYRINSQCPIIPGLRMIFLGS